MRMNISINNDWYFKPSFTPEDVRSSSVAGFEAISLPHTNKVLPLNYFDEKDFQFVSCYKKTLVFDENWRGKDIFINFGAIMTQAKIYYNGLHIKTHQGGYTPIQAKLPDSFAQDKNAIITVEVDSRELDKIPPFGGQIDYLTYGGIYREVELEITDKTHIAAFFPFPKVSDANTKIDFTSRIQSEESTKSSLKVALFDGQNLIAEQEYALSLEKGENAFSASLENLQGITQWDLHQPQLYTVVVSLNEDKIEKRIGFRTMEFKPEGFFLNGKRVQIRGLNRHQSFPYVGYAMPKRAQQKDADIMKYELGLNTVRSSHYPPSKYFLDRCDEIGLLVFDEIPGWQHIGGKAWQDVATENVREMIERDLHHPSIFIWGVRINESADNHDFYTRTNAVAKELDPDRSTGGVRCINDSELLEDVYTINDFVHNNGYITWRGAQTQQDVSKAYERPMTNEELDTYALREQQQVTGLDHKVPYFITEYNGHMYPTKSFDQEERMIEHALRHARVQNAAYGDAYIAGAIGWCFFDYNTHKDFGSGDHICHHGVSDIFRIPKWAAYIYASQQDPQEKVVLQGLTYWTRGERSIGGIAPLTVATNCDSVDFYYGSEKLGSFSPATEEFPHLPHPPVILREIEGEWGMHWDAGEIVGFIDGKEVARQKFSANPTPVNLEVTVDDTELSAGDWDSSRVVIRLLDEHNNPLPFVDEIIELECEGVGEIIGPDSFSLIAGVRAFWVKTQGTAGNIDIKISTRYHQLQQSISFHVT